MRQLTTILAAAAVMAASTSCSRNAVQTAADQPPAAPAAADTTVAAPPAPAATPAPAAPTASGPSAAAPDAGADNPLLAEWRGPHGGVPAFDRMDLASIKPALEAGMAREPRRDRRHRRRPGAAHLREHHRGDGARRAAPLNRAFTYCRHLGRQPLDARVPRPSRTRWRRKLAGIHHRRSRRTRSCSRACAPSTRARETASRPAAEQRLREARLRRLRTQRRDARRRRQGALRGDQPAPRRAAHQVRQQRARRRGGLRHCSSTPDQLGGLPDSFEAAAAATAKERGQEGKYAVTNTRSSIDPFLTYSTERALREKVWRTFYSRGDNGDEHDNNALIAEILKLRHERVRPARLRQLRAVAARGPHGEDARARARR